MAGFLHHLTPNLKTAATTGGCNRLKVVQLWLNFPLTPDNKNRLGPAPCPCRFCGGHAGNAKGEWLFPESVMENTGKKRQVFCKNCCVLRSRLTESLIKLLTEKLDVSSATK
jgi:hypothetical protein